MNLKFSGCLDLRPNLSNVDLKSENLKQYKVALALT